MVSPQFKKKENGVLSIKKENRLFLLFTIRFLILKMEKLW
jgi:hypothetical protein